MTPTTPPEPLIFDWHKPRAPWARLMFWLFVSAFGLASFFALFNVVYPQTQRFVPTAQQITLLSESDPAARDVLNVVQDRDFLILPPFDQAKNAVNLEDRAPVFHPSFEKHELKLQDLPQRDGPAAPVRLLDVTVPVLPRLDLSEMRRRDPAPPAAAAHLALHLEGPLARREIRSRPDFKKLQVSEPEAWRIHLGVDAQGRVSFALPVENPGKPEEVAPLLRLLRQVRFAPAENPQAPDLWGTASLVWSPPAAP